MQAGQESFRSVTRIFYRGAHCVFLTYDITRDETFANLVEWLKEIQNHAAEDVKIYLIGNKSEMEEQREVFKERAIEFAKEHNIHKVFETSAKTGDNVEEVFSAAAREIFVQQVEEGGDDGSDDDDIKTKPGESAGGKKAKSQPGAGKFDLGKGTGKGGKTMKD